MASRDSEVVYDKLTRDYPEHAFTDPQELSQRLTTLLKDTASEVYCRPQGELRRGERWDAILTLMRVCDTVLLLLLFLAWLQPAPAAAEFFLDFSPPEWSVVCHSGCGVYLNESVDGAFVLTSGDACAPAGGDCLEARVRESFLASIQFSRELEDNVSVYFEAMVWHDGDGDGRARSLFVAKNPGDHEVLFSVLPDGRLRLEAKDLPSAPGTIFDTPPGTTPVPPRTWVRVGLRLTVLSVGDLAYEIFVDDGPDYAGSLDYGFGDPNFQEYYALGDFSAGTHMRLDDVCIGHDEDVRDDFCAPRRATPPVDAGMPPADAAPPPADSGTPPTEDAAVPDAEPPPQDSSSDAPEGGPSFRGSGGCTCDTAGGPSPLDAGARLAALVLLFAFRRRR